MDNFESLGLPAPLLKALAKMEFTTPTPIQAQAIPPALEGKDILGSAQTGTGKTAAFGIPMVAKLLANPRSAALVMTPTRELADQVLSNIKDLLGAHSGIQITLLIGGESMPKQTQQLRTRPRIIVGTPGRINDHIERGNLMLHMTDFLVLDETDRMLDMGFLQQIEQVVKFLPAVRQTLLFSATLPANIVKMSERYLKNPVRVAVEASKENTPKIAQEIVHLEQSDKAAQLLRELERREGSVIVFMKTKWNAKKMATRLERAGQSAEAIHGDLSQNARNRVIEGFRDYKYRVLVATDIAARGLDIPHIEHVVNYDLPQSPEDYVHRIGRTARAGAEGSAVCFLTPDDALQWKAISKLFEPGALPETEFPEGRNYAPKKSNSGSRRGSSANGGGGNASRDGNSSRGGAKRHGQKRRRPGGSDDTKKSGDANGSSRKKYAPKKSGGSSKPDSKKQGSPKFSGRKLDIGG